MERFLTDSARRTESRSAAAINQRVRQIRRGSEGHSLFIGDGLTGYRDGVGGDGAMTVHIIIGGVLGGIKGGIIGGVGGAIVGPSSVRSSAPSSAASTAASSVARWAATWAAMEAVVASRERRPGQTRKGGAGSHAKDRNLSRQKESGDV